MKTMDREIVPFVARRVAERLAPGLEERLRLIYGREWLRHVNGRRKAEGLPPGRGLHDHRFCLAVFGYDPATSGWADDQRRQATRELNALSNKALHDERLTAGDLERLTRIAALFEVPVDTALHGQDRIDECEPLTVDRSGVFDDTEDAGLSGARTHATNSHRAQTERTESEAHAEFIRWIGKGHVRKGIVSRITAYGAFVDLGGVEGLVHLSELSWKEIVHPAEVVEVGQEVEVEVLDFDPWTGERISLSLKARQEDPLQRFARTCSIGQIIAGKVTKTDAHGAFVRIDDDVEGYVPLSELAHRRPYLPEQVVRCGMAVTVKVIDIDLSQRRISLSLKQANEASATRAGG